MPSLICPKCKQQIKAKKEFCSNCGTKMTTTKCLVCKRELKLDEEYCTQCGAKRDTKKAQKFTVGFSLKTVCLIITIATCRTIRKNQEQAYLHQERIKMNRVMDTPANREKMEQIRNGQFIRNKQRSSKK